MLAAGTEEEFGSKVLEHGDFFGAVGGMHLPFCFWTVDSEFTTNADDNDTPSWAESMEKEDSTRRNASWVFFFTKAFFLEKEKHAETSLLLLDEMFVLVFI